MWTKCKRIIRYILALPKTLYINFRVFDLKDACKIPVICSNTVRISEIHKGSIVLDETPKFGMVKLGLSDGSYDNGNGKKSFLKIAKGGRLVFADSIVISNDFSININGGGLVRIGRGFWSNHGLVLSCSDLITFGDNVLLGWNCTFLDSDGHSILKNSSKEHLNKNRSISIGDHVWITSNAIVLKGGSIASDSIVSQGCIVTHKFNESNVIIGGVPGQIIKTDINWEK